MCIRRTFWLHSGHASRLPLNLMAPGRLRSQKLRLHGSTTADTSRFTTHQTHSPNAPNSEPDVTFKKQSNSSEAPPAAEKEWLQGIVEPLPESKAENESEKDLKKTQHEMSIRRKRVQGLIDLMISTRGIRFNKSNATFSFTSNNLAHETSTSSIKILQFLRDLQQYRKKCPKNTFLFRTYYSPQQFL